MNIPDKIWVVCIKNFGDLLWEPVEATFSRERAETLALTYGMENNGIPRAFIKLIPIRKKEYFDTMGADAGNEIG